jgi:hypothetical protein
MPLPYLRTGKAQDLVLDQVAPVQGSSHPYNNKQSLAPISLRRHRQSYAQTSTSLECSLKRHRNLPLIQSVTGQGRIRLVWNELSELIPYSSEQQFTPLGSGTITHKTYKPLQIGIPGPSAPKLAKYAGTRRAHSAIDDGGPASKRAKTTTMPEKAQSTANRPVFHDFQTMNFAHDGLRRHLRQRLAARRLREGVRA